MTLRARIVVLSTVLLGALPLVVARPAPFTDWPNHIARVFIGVALLRGDPFWSRFYSINPVPVPNEALDLGIGALHFGGLNVDVAATVFLVFAYVVFVFGFWRFARLAGASDPTKPVIASIMFTSGPLMYGLVNYLLGIGLAMWSLSLWARAPPRHRWMIAVFGAVVLFFVHILAVVFWIVVAAWLELPALVAARRAGVARMLASASVVGGGIMFLVLLAFSPVAGDSVPNADGSNVWYMGHETVAATLRWKAGIFARIFTDHADPSVAIATWCAIAILVLMAAFAARPSIAVPAAAATATLFAAALALPESAGTGSLLDYRFALLPMLVGVAAVQLAWRSALARRAAFALLVAVSVMRSADFALAFRQQAPIFRAFESVVRTLPRGSIMLVARGRADEDIPVTEWWSPPMEHVAARAVLQGVFVPTVFAVNSQQPVVLKPAFDPWRREWRIATSAELAAMIDDIRPLCRIAMAQGRDIFLFVAYPGPVAAAIDASALIVATPKFRVLDACRLEPDLRGFASTR